MDRRQVAEVDIVTDVPNTEVVIQLVKAGKARVNASSEKELDVPTKLSFDHDSRHYCVLLLTLTLYRLYLHPLARFPCPKLAAITRLYEGYYDLYQSGQYSFKIAELHKQYGPIIRISPYELHEGVWHKYNWSVDAFATKGATIWMADHTLHKNRRLPLNLVFSTAKVSMKQGMIMRHAQALFGRLPRFSGSQNIIDLDAAFTAFGRDVTNEYIFGKHYNDLGKEDFDAGMIMAISNPIMKDYFRFMIISMNNTKNFMKAAASPTDEGPRTLVHEIVQSKLAPSDKSFERVYEEMSTTTGTGFKTTAALAAAPGHDCKTLEKLLYLTVTIIEAMCIALAIATRSAQIAHNKDLNEDQHLEPKRFHPDRWMDPNPWQLGNKTFVPFGKGKRNCLGMYLTWAEI
ncbi:cytochrome P450 [Hypoxylon argillaceum]|nr:cytochrome P450 [Hypoxylon argillaceum]